VPRDAETCRTDSPLWGRWGRIISAQTVAYAPTGNATGIIQQAMCQADQTVTTELTCTILFNDQTGAYTINVVTDPQGDWHQLCEPGDQQAGRLCRETATP
jgi:hypothetical protein